MPDLQAGEIMLKTSYVSVDPYLRGRMSEAKLKYTETIVEGFDQIPQAFIDLFEGKNKGKMVVKI